MNDSTRYEGGRSGNLFLDSLVSAPTSLHHSIRYQEPKLGTSVASSKEDFASVYFPTTSVISNVVRLSDGTTVESSLVGREGFFGVTALLADTVSAGDAVFQVAGGAWRIATSDFIRHSRTDEGLRTRGLQYTSYLLATTAQIAACNRVHTLTARLARWLLMVSDRIRNDRLVLTQEVIATMLGVRRQGVSSCAAALEEAGLIFYERGRIDIRDRAGLIEATCECYQTIDESVGRLLRYELRR